MNDLQDKVHGREGASGVRKGQGVAGRGGDGNSKKSISSASGTSATGSMSVASRFLGSLTSRGATTSSHPSARTRRWSSASDEFTSVTNGTQEFGDSDLYTISSRSTSTMESGVLSDIPSFISEYTFKTSSNQGSKSRPSILSSNASQRSVQSDWPRIRRTYSSESLPETISERGEATGIIDTVDASPVSNDPLDSNTYRSLIRQRRNIAPFDETHASGDAQQQQTAGSRSPRKFRMFRKGTARLKSTDETSTDSLHLRKPSVNEEAREVGYSGAVVDSASSSSLSVKKIKTTDLEASYRPEKNDGQSSSNALQIPNSETAPSTQRRRLGGQRAIERVRLCYHDTGPLAKARKENPTLSNKGHSYRVQLVALNFELPETSIMVDRNSTFSQLGFQLCTANVATLPIALEQISGPFPRWKIPAIDSKVPRGLQKIYVADISEPFTLALVRDAEEDFPLLIALESFNTGTTVGDLIDASLGGRARSWASVKLLSSPSDIQKLACNLVQEEIKGAYSTTIFILLTADPVAYRFRNKYSQVPPPLRLALPLCRSLVESAPRLKAFDLQAIGLSRGLLHVAICLAEAAMESKVEGATEAYLISRLNNFVNKLNDIFLAVESSTESSLREIRHSMDRFFYELCEEQPGAVSVRQFLESFKPLTPFDYEKTGSKDEGGSGIQDVQTLVAQNASKEPAVAGASDAEDGSTGSSDSLTLSDGESAEGA